MEYGKIITDALDIAWRQRHLWVFGFFAGVGSPNLDNRLTGADRIGEVWEWLSAHPALAALLGTIALVIGLIFWVLQVISQGSLVHGVGEIEASRTSSFEDSLNLGLKRFWRVLGLQLLMVAVILAFLAFAGGPPLLMLLFGGTGLRILGVIWLVAAILPAVAGLIGLGLIWNYSLRYCVLHEQPVVRSIGMSWSLIKANFSESVILFAIGLGIGLALGLAVVLALVILAIPFIILGIIKLALGLVPGLIIGIPAFVLSICILGVFQSAYWTLGFMRLPFNRRTPEGAGL